MEELTLFEKACKAYARVCKNGTPLVVDGGISHPLAYCVPSEVCSEIGRKYVYLRNCNGDLAKYEIKTGKISI